MPSSHRLTVRSRLVFLLGLVSLPTLLVGQATRDQPTLTLGAAGGAIMGTRDFWRVPNQPIQAPDLEFDVFDLSRKLTGNVTLSLQASLFAKPNFGYTAEMTYLGIGTSDTCLRVQATEFEFNQLVCTALNRDVRSTSATALTTGAIIRPWSRALLQPYVKMQAGIAIISDNLTAMTAYLGPGQQVVQRIYPTPGTMSVNPTASTSLGVLANVGTGYLVRVEARNHWLRISRVAGASAQDRIAPPTEKVVRSFPSLMIGLDVVLEKSRGRRY